MKASAYTICTPQEQRVLDALIGGARTWTAAVRSASPTCTPGSAKTLACRFRKSERVARALAEESLRRVGLYAAVAAQHLFELMTDPDADPEQRRLAAGSLLDRAGLGRVHQQQINVTKTPAPSRTDQIAELRALAGVLGQDARVLLGSLADVSPHEIEEDLIG